MTFKTRLFDSLRKISTTDSEPVDEERADMLNEHEQSNDNSDGALTYDQQIHITKDIQREFEDIHHERLTSKIKQLKKPVTVLKPRIKLALPPKRAHVLKQSPEQRLRIEYKRRLRQRNKRD